MKTCPSCGFTGIGDYCSQCGQLFEVKRLTVKGLLYDAILFFTQFEKGFGYTLKQLVIAPGHMQSAYIRGNRRKHQNPLSMFFICATIAAVTRSWILYYMLTHFHSVDPAEINFFREYMVFLYVFLVPFYAILPYSLFSASGYNYAEMIVLLLYTISVFFLASPFLFLLLFMRLSIDLMYLEFVVYSIYFIITFLNFFKTYSRWKVILFSIFTLAIAFLINQIAENFVIKLIS